MGVDGSKQIPSKLNGYCPEDDFAVLLLSDAVKLSYKWQLMGGRYQFDHAATQYNLAWNVFYWVAALDRESLNTEIRFTVRNQ